MFKCNELELHLRVWILSQFSTLKIVPTQIPMERSKFSLGFSAHLLLIQNLVQKCKPVARGLGLQGQGADKRQQSVAMPPNGTKHH